MLSEDDTNGLGNMNYKHEGTKQNEKLWMLVENIGLIPEGLILLDTCSDVKDY